MKLLLLILLSITLPAKTLEIYFDTPQLTLLKNNSSLKYQASSYTSKKNKLKYKESIIYTYDINKTKIFPVKHYNTVKSIEEKHPLLALVKRANRPLLIETLKQNAIIYPLKLKYIFKTSDTNKTYPQLYKQHTKDTILFSLMFNYPYLKNLLYAIITAIIGALLIYTLFRKRLTKHL